MEDKYMYMYISFYRYRPSGQNCKLISDSENKSQMTHFLLKHNYSTLQIAWYNCLRPLHVCRIYLHFWMHVMLCRFEKCSPQTGLVHSCASWLSFTFIDLWHLDLARPAWWLPVWVVVCPLNNMLGSKFHLTPGSYRVQTKTASHQAHTESKQKQPPSIQLWTVSFWKWAHEHNKSVYASQIQQIVKTCKRPSLGFSLNTGNAKVGRLCPSHLLFCCRKVWCLVFWNQNQLKCCGAL